MKKYFSFLILSLAACLLFVKVAFAYVEIDIDNSPPQPSDTGLLISNPVIVGTSNSYQNSSYSGGFIASNYAPAYYGTFISQGYSGIQMHICAYYQIGTGGNWRDTDIKVQGFVGSAWSGYSNQLWDSSHVPSWGAVWDKNSTYFSSYVYTYNNNINYFYYHIAVELSPQLTSDDYTFYNDLYQNYTNGNWYDLTNAQIFNLCTSFSHPTLLGEYDETVPTFQSADFVATKQDRESARVLQVTGSLNNVLTDSSVFDSSLYTIDYRGTVQFGMWQLTGNWNAGDISTKLRKTYNFTLTKYDVSSLDLSLFNGEIMYISDYELPSAYQNCIYTVDSLTFNVRLRRKSDGNYGDWFVLSMSNTGLGITDDYKTNAISGISSGADDSTNATPNINSDLTDSANIKVNFSIDGTSLGTSFGSRLYEGGGYVPSVDVGQITTTFGQVPQFFANVFSFLPPFVLQFIAMAFVTIIAVAIVKAIL